MIRLNGFETLKRIIAALFMVMLSLSVASAADSPAARNACADDVAKYCRT